VFVGFVPVDHPKIVIAVVLDEPMIGRYGGDLAGPVFRRVAEASLRYLGVSPPASLSNLAAARRAGDPADAALVAPRGAQSPPPPTPGEASAPAPGDGLRVPNTAGMGAHDVVATLTRAGLVPQIDGWGRAVRQIPAPGSIVPKGSQVRVVLEPAS
jgi:cell division protein FtsI (penicillin-binding protein 3)